MVAAFSFAGQWDGTETLLTGGSAFVYEFVVAADGAVSGHGKSASALTWTVTVVGAVNGIDKLSWKEYSLDGTTLLGTFAAVANVDNDCIVGDGNLTDGRALRFQFTRITI
jgi:hypothetical protein